MSDLSDTQNSNRLSIKEFKPADKLNISLINARRYFYCQGSDASKFLQGQLTCNINEVSLSQSRLGLHCTAQGRSLSSFRVIQSAENRYLFQCHQSLYESFQEQLGKYMVFSKAEFTSPEEPYTGICIEGSQALKHLQKTWPELQVGNEKDHSCINNNGICIQVDQQQQLFELWLPTTVAETFRQAAEQDGAIEYEPAFYDWQLIRQGLAVLNEASSETYIPQMLNYELINGISFNKGCYTGQEVVARAKYRGQVKRRLQRFLLSNTNTVVSTGDDIFSLQNGHSKKAGTVVNSIISPQGLEVLAVISVNELNNTGLHLAKQSHENFQALELPYAIFNEDN